MLMEHQPLSGTPIAINGGAALTIRHAQDCARFSLRIAAEHADEAAAEAFGCDLPRSIGGMTNSVGRFALCLGPDEWLLMAPAKEEEGTARRFASLYAQVPHSLVDIGHRETGIEIEGPAAALALAAACPLDLASMPAGTCTRTIFDKAQIVLIKRNDTSYRIEVWRSFAPHVWGLLEAVSHEIALGI
jgi:sarcosine oxidase subunit gamma